MSNWIQRGGGSTAAVSNLSGEQARDIVVMTRTLSLAAAQEADRQCRNKNSRQQGEEHTELVVTMVRDEEKVGIPSDASLNPGHIDHCRVESRRQGWVRTSSATS